MASVLKRRSFAAPSPFLLALLGCVAWLGFGALAADQRPSTDLRIAVVDPNRIIEESPQYEAAQKLLIVELAKRETTLIEQQEAIDRLQNRLERDAALMSADEFQRLQNDIRSRQRRLRYEKEEMQEDFALRKNELRTRLVKQVEEVVARIAQEKGIDLILTDGVVYFSERMDVSVEIIERLKQEFPGR